MKNHILTATALLVGLYLTPALAQAPGASPSEGATKTQAIQTSDTGWQVICRPTSADRAKLNCTVVFETISTNERVRLAGVEIIKGEKGRVIIVSTPQGVSLKDGIELVLDGGAKTPVPYSSCQGNICFGVIDLKDDMIANFKKAKSVSISYADAQGNKVKIDTSLTGFTQALAKAD